jgi:hypothetical protein
MSRITVLSIRWWPIVTTEQGIQSNSNTENRMQCLIYCFLRKILFVQIALAILTTGGHLCKPSSTYP